MRTYSIFFMMPCVLFCALLTTGAAKEDVVPGADLIEHLKVLTKDIPKGSMVAWSRGPIQRALGRRMVPWEIANGLEQLGLRSIDQYLPPPPKWSTSHNIRCVLQYHEDTKSNEKSPLYSITQVVKKSKGTEITLHGIELKLWKAMGRKIVWIDKSHKATLAEMKYVYVSLEIGQEMLANLPNNPLIRMFIDPKYIDNPQQTQCETVHNRVQGVTAD